GGEGPAARGDLAGHREAAVDGAVGRGGDDGGGDGDAGGGAVLGDRAGGHVHVEVVVGEEAAVEALLRGVGAGERQRRLRGFLHHLAELAGKQQLTFAGN